MALIFERETISRGRPKTIIEKFDFTKNENPQDKSMLIPHNLAIPIGHLSRDSEELLEKTHLRTSRRLSSEYVLPVMVSITKDMAYIIDRLAPQPTIVASLSHKALADLRPFEDEPGIPFVIFWKNGQEFMGRLTEEEAYKDPPIRFGNFIFRRSQLSTE